MTRWRGLVATLSALTLIHLILLSAGGGCLLPSPASAHGAAMPHDRVAEREAPQPQGHHAHTAPAPSSAAPQHDAAETSGRHGGTQLCTSLAPCSIAAVPVTESEHASQALHAHERVEWAPRVLSSIALAPELPPPRA